MANSVIEVAKVDTTTPSNILITVQNGWKLRVSKDLVF